LITYTCPLSLAMSDMMYDFETQRREIIESLRKMGIYDERVLSAMAAIPRELFVEESKCELAYADRALPISMGQTIPQPLMVATMTQALQLKGHERVLEVGTGSGYQAAILGCLAAHVYSIDRHQQLAYQAAKRLQRLGLQNASLYVSDGSLGWPNATPYDRILVTAAAHELPAQLMAQHLTWAMLVIPGRRHDRQDCLI